MRQSHTDDSIDGFTLELLRAGYALTNLGAEVADALAESPECDDGGGSAAYEMISGSIRSYLDEVDAAAVDRATELMCGAMDRVIEQMQLALELRRRMEADGPDRRGYDDPELAAFMDEAQAGVGAPDLAPRPEPEDVTHELAIELFDAGAALSQLVAGMMEWTSSPRTPPTAVPLPEAAHNLLRAIIGEFDGRYGEHDLATAAALLRDLTHALTHDVYVVDPDFEELEGQ